MAKAGLLFVGTDDGLVLFSDPGGTGRWLQVGHVLRGQPVRTVWARADDPLTVLAAGPTVQRSQDGGRTWELVLDVDAIALQGIRAEPTAVTLVTTDGLRYHSGDAGATWASAEADASDAPPADAVVTLPGKEPVQLRAQPGGVERSSDNGATWAATEADAPWSAPVSVIAPASYHIDTAFAGSAAGQLAISSDRGRTWRMIKQDLPPVRSIAAARLV